MYRPGGYSDDEDSDDEFDCGYDMPKQKAIRIVKTAQDELEDAMYEAICTGNLSKLEESLQKVPVNLDDRLHHGYSLLMYACSEAHPHIVRFLIEKGATVNMDVESYTPLMMACRAEKDSNIVLDIVKQLLDNGAIVNQSNLYGETPLIYASQNGHTEVVRLIIKDASLDACSNQLGNSALFFAVEKNYLEIVKLLLEHGASFNVTNSQGYLPKVIAEMHGFADIVALFPKEEEKYQIPDTFLVYQHYTDLVPGVLGHKPEVPPYFYRIREILNGLSLESLLPDFAKSGTSLPQFLTMNEAKLAKAGIDLPIFQKKILLGLLKFHAHKWSRASVAPLGKAKVIDTYHVYSMMAGQLQHLVVMRCSLIFLCQLLTEHEGFPPMDVREVWKVMKDLESYMRELFKIFLMMEKVRAETKPLLEEITAAKARTKPKENLLKSKIIKYSSILGVVSLLGIFLTMKLK